MYKFLGIVELIYEGGNIAKTTLDNKIYGDYIIGQHIYKDINSGKIIALDESDDSLSQGTESPLVDTIIFGTDRGGVDGGNAFSVFTTEQEIDGGGA